MFYGLPQMQGTLCSIVLTMPVVNPIFLKQLKWIVKYICKKCKRIVITKQHLSVIKATSHQYLIRQQKKKSRHPASGHAYEGISDILRRKGRHIRKPLCGKRANQGERTVLGRNFSLKIDQVGIPKDISLPSRWSSIA